MYNTISSYSEASYFDGYHFQHIAAFEDEKRLKRIRRSAEARIARERRSGGRAMFARAA